MIKIYICIVLFLNPLYLFAINFDELKKYTLENSTELKVSDLDILLADKELKIIDSEYYPQLSVGFNMESSNSLSDSQNSTYIDNSSVSNEKLKKSYSSLNLNYNLYDFGRISAKSSSQKHVVNSLKYEYCKKEKAVVERLLESYYKSLIYQNKNTTLNKVLELQNSIFNLNKRLFEIGDIDNITLTDSSIEVANLYSDLKKNESLFTESFKELENISHYDLEESMKLQSLVSISSSQRKISFEDTSDAQALQNKIKSKKAQIELYTKEYLPQVNFYSKYDAYGSDQDSFSGALEDMSSNSFKVGFSISWNLFNGFKTTSQKQKALLELQQLTYKYELEKRDFETKLETIENNIALEKEILQKRYQNQNSYQRNNQNSKRLNTIGEITTVQKLKKEIQKLYGELEYKESKEKLAYESIKQNIYTVKGLQCTVR